MWVFCVTQNRQVLTSFLSSSYFDIFAWYWSIVVKISVLMVVFVTINGFSVKICRYYGLLIYIDMDPPDLILTLFDLVRPCSALFGFVQRPTKSGLVEQSLGKM